MAPKAQKQSNGAAAAGKLKPKVSAPSSGTATPSAAPADAVVTQAAVDQVVYGSGKPDKAVYDAEQNKVKAEIDGLQVKLSAVKEKLSGGRSAASQERRKQLLDELQEIRNTQGNIKQARSKVFDQLKALQDGVQKKIKDLNAAKAKVPFKTVQDVDNRIDQLDKQIESGNMKVADEKRALAEISQLKRSRRAVEGFQAEQDTIEADRKQAEELRKQLDDPESKAVSERYDTIQTELDEIKKQADQSQEARNKLLDERSALQAQLDTLYSHKRDSAQRFRDANDRFYSKMQEDRARRAERARKQREEEEAAKKHELAERLREEAEVPAFQAQIEDCQTLIEYFSGKSTAPPTLSADREQQKSAVAGVPELEIRKVEEPVEGVVALKKKGEESYFVGGGGKKKGKKQHAKATPATDAVDATSKDRLNVPMSTLSALLSLSIPPPTSGTDVPRLVEDLKTKKAWYEANQARVTAENKAKAEKEIERLTGHSNKVTIPVSDDLTPPNGGSEQPAEPAPTPAISDVTSVPVPDDEVAEKLESVQEAEEVAVPEEQ